MGKPLICALMTIIMWSSLAALTISIKHIPSLLSVGLVLLVAAIPGLRYWKHWHLPPSIWISAIIGMFGYHYLLFDAFSRAPAMSVNMIQYLWPLFIVLGTPLVTKVKLNAGHIIGALMGFVGVLLTLSQDNQGFNFNAENWLGYTEAFIAAILWAFYTLSNKRYTNMPLSAVAGFCLISGVLALVSYIAISGFNAFQEVNWQWQDGLSILLLGLGPMGLSFYTWDYAIRHGDPRTVGSLSYLTPLLSVALMAAIYSDIKLTWLHLIALALVCGGASLGQLVQHRKIKHQTYYVN